MAMAYGYAGYANKAPAKLVLRGGDRKYRKCRKCRKRRRKHIRNASENVHKKRRNE